MRHARSLLVVLLAAAGAASGGARQIPGDADPKAIWHRQFTVAFNETESVGPLFVWHNSGMWYYDADLETEAVYRDNGRCADAASRWPRPPPGFLVTSNPLDLPAGATATARASTRSAARPACTWWSTAADTSSSQVGPVRAGGLGGWPPCERPGEASSALWSPCRRAVTGAYAGAHAGLRECCKCCDSSRG
jgi:hypothetical protein